MKFFIAVLALAATAIAGDVGSEKEGSSTCDNGSSPVCKDNGNGGLLTLGNVATGALGESCSGGDVYCCTDKDIKDVRPISSHLMEMANNLPLLDWPCEPRRERSVQSEPPALNGHLCSFQFLAVILLLQSSRWMSFSDVLARVVNTVRED